MLVDCRISIGSKTSIWGVDIAGLPHQFDAASNSWQKRPGRGLTKISVGSDGEVWAISQDNRPMRYRCDRSIIYNNYEERKKNESLCVCVICLCEAMVRGLVCLALSKRSLCRTNTAFGRRIFSAVSAIEESEWNWFIKVVVFLCIKGLFVWHGNQWQPLAGGEQYHGATITKFGAWAFNAAGTPYFSVSMLKSLRYYDYDYYLLLLLLFFYASKCIFFII